MDREIELLSRVAANHLFLAQFEALRAALLSLRKRDPDLALSILRALVFQGGRFDGVLWSSGTCPSPAHLAWLACLELVGSERASSSWGVDRREITRLRVEFLLLVHLVCSRTEEALQQDGKGNGLEGGSEVLGHLRRVMDWGLRRLKGEEEEDDPEKVASLDADDVLSSLRPVFLENADVLYVLCWNIHKQIHLSERQPELSVRVSGEAEGSSDLPIEGLKAVVKIRKHVQAAHLDALRKYIDKDDLERAISHVTYLHQDFGVEESEYRFTLQALIKKVSESKANSGETWHQVRNTMLMIYEKVLSSGCIHLVQMVQAIQDEYISNEIEQHRVTDGATIPLPLQKYLDALKLAHTTNSDDQTFQGSLGRYCMIDIYHYARVTESHVLECIMESALAFVKKGQLQDACDVLYLFPLLQPLIAAMGWDLLPGNTKQRRQLMQLLWISKSQALRLEESSLYEKQSDEISCVEYLCDLLCYHLDLASFVACVNSGQQWKSKDSMLFSRKEQGADDNVARQLDPFVENFVIERLAVQTPLRVLFDVVPGIKFQDAIELITMQPMNSTTMAWKRMQDIELMHLRYALESAVIALGAMESHTGDNDESHYLKAIWHLKDLRNHMEAVSSIPRKVFMLSIIISLLHMDKLSVDLSHCTSPPSYSQSWEHDPTVSCEGSKNMVASFTRTLLDILRHSLPVVGSELDDTLKNGGITTSGKQALEWRISNIRHFTEDWEWRLSILQRLLPLSGHSWNWKESLAILRAAPSNLLNLCLQKAKYDIGEEAVHRFSLSAEDKAALELNEWVTGAFRIASVEDTVSRAAEGVTDAVQELDFSSLRSQLGPLVAILLCIDVAATSARSMDTCLLLLNKARGMLSEIYPGGSPRVGSSYWDQIQEVAVISVIRRILQRLLDLLEQFQEKHMTLQHFFAGETFISPPKEPTKQGQRQSALAILHQMIDDAHKGKRQFLSGKLHNLARVVAEEDTEINYLKGDYIYPDKKNSAVLEKGAVLGLALKPVKRVRSSSLSVEQSAELAGDIKDTGKRFLAPLSSKLSTYLSAFIVYIATIGDIVDGIDTTHDFNFFSLVYEWPKDLLTRLVFERESTDAASKVADIMGADFVHEVISACVPPVFPPRSGHGWACIPLLPSLSRPTAVNRVSFQPVTEVRLGSSISVSPVVPLYPLKLDIVKHLAKLSPVRAILACVFGSSILSSGSGLAMSSSSNADFVQAPDTERLFYEFALDQSERFPTLNRWIQMQSNLHRVSESAMAAFCDNDSLLARSEAKVSIKRSREPESDTESDIDDVVGSSHISAITSDANTQIRTTSDSWHDSPKSANAEIDSTSFLSLDWENERPYGKAVERLMNEGKLMDALALSDRFLRDGACDQLLQLLIEDGEDGGANYPCSISWQYCLRLKDKQLAARLALKYLHKWELENAMDVLTMCSFHLHQNDPIRSEVLLKKLALQKYSHILCADENYNNWQEVEIDCKEDPEGLALRLAGKGAVSAALEVAESAVLSVDLRRELQGRQLVKLLTTDPLSGGGPAEASRFLSSLRDPDDALPVAMGAMQQLHDLRSKQLLVHFFLKRRAGTLSEAEVNRLNLWALGLRVLSILPASWQQRCSSLHEHPHLILEVLLMMKQLQYASLILKEFPSLRDDNLVLEYSAKAITVGISSAPREPRISVSGPRPRQKSRPGILSRSNITNSLSNLQKEARRAFSWAPRDTGSKDAPKDIYRKRKSSGVMPLQRGSWEAMSGIQEERVSVYSSDGHERLPSGSVAEEWVLTGDPTKDNIVRSSHKYETSPDIVLFKGLLMLCSDELVSAKGALDLCITQMKNVLSSQQLPLHASMEAIGRAYHATETYVQAMTYAKTLLRKLAGSSDLSSNSDRSRDADDVSAETSSSSGASQYHDELSELQARADTWFGRAELLQSLLGSGIVASLDDIADTESSARLRDRLIQEERYSMAVYTCRKCKIDVFPVWNSWGHALIRMECYAQARVKFKQALQLYKGDPSQIVLDIVNGMEGVPPVDVPEVRSMYEHLAKSASTILDDSLSADAYLNVLYMPSTFPRSERSRRSQDSTSSQSASSILDFDDGPRSNLDNVRYVECIHYLQEYAPQHLLGFMFKHGHYADACMLFFPPNAMPLPPQPSAQGAAAASSPQRLDPLATDYGTIEDLSDFCVGYGAMDVLEDVLSKRHASASLDPTVGQYIVAALTRICNYSETHRHFNYLYKFQVIKRDHVAAGLCCIQLFMNSSSLEEAIVHLEHAKMHFEEALSARSRGGEATRLVSKAVRGKSASEKLTEEGLVRFSARVALQVDVVRSFNNTEGSQWQHSLFGNPNDPETFRRRCEISETLAERNFDLAFQVIYEFNLPAVDIYAGVAASLAERKRSGQLTEFFRNIKGTIGEDDWDQVLGAAINVYANKHKERPDRLIDMLISSHRKVLACVVCGRLKSAFQIASRSGSVADVQYVAHQALHANALPVLDMCKQWLAQYM